MSNVYEIAEQWLDVFSIHMLEVSLFVLVILMTDKVLRLDTRLRYLLWILALVKVFIPPILSLPGSIQPAIQGQIPLLQMNTVLAADTAANQVPISLILFVAWVVAALIVASFVVYKNLSLRYRLQKAWPIKKLEISSLCEELQFYESKNLQGPILLGLRRPRLYLPQEWLSWPENQLKSIIAHESAHIQQRDVFVLLAQYIGLILFWMNPLVWLVHTRLNQLRELLCDEFAIQKTGISPVAYSKLIVKFLEEKNSTPMLIGKCFSKNTKTLFNRVNHLLNLKEATMKTKNLLKFGLPVLFILLIFVFSWKCGEQKSQEILNSTDSESIQAEINKRLSSEITAKGIKETVRVSFIVNENGEVVDLKILNATGDNKSDFEKIVLNTVKKENWKSIIERNNNQPMRVEISGAPLKTDENNADVFVFSTKSFNVAEIPPPPPRTLNSGSEFQPYDKPPTPIGGFKAIQENLKYPEIARKAGIEGQVVVHILISEEGKVLETKILKSLGDSGCDEAAVNALKNIDWEPAQQKGRPVKVWVAVPILFKLNSDNDKEVFRNQSPALFKVSLSKKVQEAILSNKDAWDIPPTPIGGFKAIQQNLHYPEIARKAGIEGQVIVQVLVSEDGKVAEARILESLGHNGCDEAAVQALKNVDWQPATKDGQPVKTWFAVPVVFKLN